MDTQEVATREEFDGALSALCQEHALHPTGLRHQDRLFSDLHGRFFDGTIDVTLRVRWSGTEDGFYTLSTHANSQGELLLAQDGPGGRLHFFPEAWMSSSADTPPTITEIEVNARSRFSTTPGGRATGYKQQRFARETELFFQGGRILEIDGVSTEGGHTGQLLYEALKNQPGNLRLLVEVR